MANLSGMFQKVKRLQGQVDALSKQKSKRSPASAGRPTGRQRGTMDALAAKAQANYDKLRLGK